MDCYFLSPWKGPKDEQEGTQRTGYPPLSRRLCVFLVLDRCLQNDQGHRETESVHRAEQSLESLRVTFSATPTYNNNSVQHQNVENQPVTPCSPNE